MTTTQTATRSFVDLRAWAASATVTAGEGDAFLSARALLPQPKGPVTIGLIALSQGSGSVSGLPADEFVIVESGSVQIDQCSLNEGDSIVLCEGADFAWSATADARLLFVRRTGGSVADGAIIPIDANAALEPSGAPLAELLVGPTPSCRNFTDYRSADGEFVCGTWDSTPYHRRSMAYRHYELMYLLDGSVTFVDGAGAEGTFGKGDIFLVEQGASCSWDSQVHVKKVYAIYRPA
jgi:uncharacterized cupin superfamily protein